MKKNQIISLLIIGISFGNFSCSIFKNNTVTDGYTYSNIISKLTQNELIKIQDETFARINGTFEIDNDSGDNSKAGLIIWFKNIIDKKSSTTQLDFDGNYSIELKSGIYDLYILDTLILEKLKIENGEIRRLNFELNIGPETTVSVEYKNKRVWQKAQLEKEKKKQNNDDR